MLTATNNQQIPVLDLQLHDSDLDLFVQELRCACHNVGFFLLRHDLVVGMAQRQLEQSRSFFRQSPNNKMNLSYEKNPAFRGYMKLGVENTGGKTDVREQIEFGTEYAFQDTSANAPLYERLKGKNQWPDTFQPQLKQFTMDYVRHICRIADCLRKALCLALRLDSSVLDPLFEEPQWFLKLISYPPYSLKDDRTVSFGVGAHTDTNFLTLVLQDDVGGLQVFSKGEWIDVPTGLGDDVLVCNLGEQAELFSRGYFLATPHRVLANTSSPKARVSVPLFYNPSLSSTISPSDENTINLLPWERSDDYDTKRHWRMKGNVILDTVGDNTFKSLARSHPAVFAKHHKDLIRLDDGRIVRKVENEEN